MILKEFLGVQRIIGVLLSLVGALIIIRPGADVFSPTMFLPLIAATCYAAYSIATRYVGRDEDIWTSLLYTGLVGGILTSLALPFFGKMPGGFDIVLMLAIAGIGTLGQLFVIRSFSKAEAGAVAPFGYAGLVYAAVISIAFYGDYPDPWTITGSLVIAAAGIYVWHRETKAKQNRPAT